MSFHAAPAPRPSMRHIAPLIVLVAAPSAAAAQDLAVHTGVPIVVSFLGQTPADGATERNRSAHLGVDFTVEFAPSFQLGGSVDGMYVDGAYRNAEGFIYAVTAGPTALLTTEQWTGRNLSFGLSVTPGVLVLGASDKRSNARTMVSLGGLLEASLRFRLTQSFSLALFGSTGYYAAPFGEAEWLGNPLGATLLAAIDLGIVWHF